MAKENYQNQIANPNWRITNDQVLFFRCGKTNYRWFSGDKDEFREGVKKSKWKFKMAFAMKGGGGSRGGLECHIPILKNDFFKKPFRMIPRLWKRVLHLVWALYYVYIVVEITLNMAK